jgi:hypothetical protein
LVGLEDKRLCEFINISRLSKNQRLMLRLQAPSLKPKEDEMGTNYYTKEGKHLGKKSIGWRFTFHGIPEQGLVSVEDWKKAIGDGIVVSEYEEELSWEEFEKEVLKPSGSTMFDYCKDRSERPQRGDWLYTWQEIEIPGVSQGYEHTTTDTTRKDFSFATRFWKDLVTEHTFHDGEFS